MNTIVSKETLKDHQYKKELSLSVLEGKKKLIILCYLGLKGTKRFKELKNLIPDISQQTLTNQLRELEKDELIIEKNFPLLHPKFSIL